MDQKLEITKVNDLAFAVDAVILAERLEAQVMAL